MHSNIYNVISIPMAWWCRQLLCTIAEHNFTSFSKVALHHKQYCREIILVHVCLFSAAVHSRFFAYGQQCTPIRYCWNTLENKDIEHMKWLAYSPDLYPIKHTCKILANIFLKELAFLLTCKTWKMLLHRSGTISHKDSSMV